MTGTLPAPLILVVEDEPALRRDIVEELQEAGYRILAAADGQEAQDLLAGITPDLVLCDITMPKLDGYGLLSTLRGERPDLAETPFVFLTAMSEPRDVIEGKLQGADDYLVKPVDYDLLLATVDARLRQVRRIRGQLDLRMDEMREAIERLPDGGPQRVLDLITLGIVLLDGKGEVVHANRAARDMTEEAGFISIRRAALNAADPLCDKSLRRAICETLKAAADGTEATAGVMLHRPGDGQSISALVCTLTPKGPGAAQQPHVALFLSPRAQAMKVSEPLLIDLFGLTPTEARVAASLTRGARPSDIAGELGVSQTTISFHMRNLFQKTGTNRQTDLVALILAGPMAVETPSARERS
ncbi:two-component system response regulator [Pelagivirga sediminicola]|uniref:Two-component system response regulator n=1 Tax=Pelagivirga sediminicola TaxID=2170575 RepID=A0A2T7GC52_9RHOB|nr:response regulator [Pelagivirga sediminicola]PVA12005.1 two-component system response regulator [Pelagivirga sediminicola]